MAKDEGMVGMATFPADHPRWCALWRILVGALLAVIPVGCGGFPVGAPAPLFYVPLSIESEPVGVALLDTGGAYELMLGDTYGLPVVGEVDVLVYTGPTRAGVTDSFHFTAGGLKVRTEGALVGLDICDCHGVGFPFFRKTGVVVGLDFAKRDVIFSEEMPEGGTVVPFSSPPSHMQSFDSAFIDVDVTTGGETVTVRALLDTGANATVMRRGLVGQPLMWLPDQADVQIEHSALGVVAARVVLYDNEALPDMIIGTDVMGAFSDRWYFQFEGKGGLMTVYPRVDDPPVASFNTSSSDALRAVSLVH